MSSDGTEPKAFFTSYQTRWRGLGRRRVWSSTAVLKKLCSAHPLTLRTPFCASVSRLFASSHVTRRLARMSE
ncbi:hypothetical protein PHYSODRAFT_498895 [Phytophthora sojae]|uniref:Uncharacterized protein n=1 Tax=Phytophthora sojae (strain P6497) TaxID=1094619 RepID=G4ZIB3_PHYSP|nr:hypothetical protein PHYSODRAFT_498895 [Phytophthora sojae]EGZ18750.1 hypothetical protein PHYSODRAFT_498895 [Phytophthora sojae]|eukprot:XP_009527808.1 hypothetical protein PHYSODRAFT_498895 [Phytophthora sojae]